MNNHLDLGIRSERTLTDRITTAFGTLMWWLFIHPVAYFISDVVWVVLLAVIVSAPLRGFIGGWFLGLVIVLGLALLSYGWVILLGRIIRDPEELMYGKPVFRAIGGAREKMFFTVMKCAQAMEYKFRKKDEKFVRQFNRLDREITEQALKENYRLHVLGGADVPQEELDKNWKKIWEEQILKVGTEDITLEDSFHEDNIAFRILMLKFPATLQLVAPLVKVFQLIMIFLLYRHLNGATELLTLIQVGLTLSILMTLMWFVYHSNNLNEIPFIGLVDGLPQAVIDAYEDKDDLLAGKSVRPLGLVIKKRYYTLVRGFFSPTLRFGLLWNTVFALVLVGFVLLIGLLGAREQMSALLAWARSFSIGLVVIAVGFLLSYYLVFWMLQNIRRILAPAVAGLIGAVLPYGLEYVFTGQLDFSEVRGAVIATLSGMAALIGTAISTQVRKTWEED